MRLGTMLACVFVLYALGIVAAAGPWGGGETLLVAALIFFSLLTGMLVARVTETATASETRAVSLANSNIVLETQVFERTAALRDKIRELESAKEDAVAANEAKSRFLASMSHELRTPLNAILGFSEMIECQIYGTIGDKRYTEYARLIQVSGKHLLSLIRDVLDLAKIEAGKMDLHPEPLDVSAILDEAQDLVGANTKLGDRRLSVEVAGSLPMLLADRRAVIQMTVNLLSNAVKFTPEEGAIALVARLRDDGGLLIEVRDSGVGIAKADIPKALSAFGQIDGELARKHAGTGLGLPIVTSLMELHGGHFALDSELGQGTTAMLLFPADRSLTGACQAAAAR
jgi:two-component system cell cycle sensor histidine kinase PleC